MVEEGDIVDAVMADDRFLRVNEVLDHEGKTHLLFVEFFNVGFLLGA